MKGLPGLIRIGRQDMEVCRKALADLESQIAQTRYQISSLNQRVLAEGEHTGQTVEEARAFSAFLSASLTRKAALEETLERLRIDAEDAREKVADAYREVRKLELAEQRDQERAALETRRREQAVLDDIGLSMHRRNGARSAD